MRARTGGCLWCGKRAAYRLGMRPVAHGRHGYATFFHLCDQHGRDALAAVGLEDVDGYPLMEGARDWPLPRSPL